MDRRQALELLEKHLTTQNLFRHSLAVEAIMEALAERLAPEEKALWGLTGLLHDLDADEVDYRTSPEQHGPRAVEIMRAGGLTDERLHRAVMAHNPLSGTRPDSLLEKAIYAADPMSGFITANALILKDKRLASVQAASVVKRMGEKRFAAGADREAMRSIESLGIPFETFVDLSLEAMLPLAESLGL